MKASSEGSFWFVWFDHWNTEKGSNVCRILRDSGQRGALRGGEPAGKCTWPLKPADTAQEKRLGRTLRRRNVNQCGFCVYLKQLTRLQEATLDWSGWRGCFHLTAVSKKLQLWAGLQVLAQTDHNQPDSSVVSTLKSLLFLFYPSKDAAGNQTRRCMRRSAGSVMMWEYENIQHQTPNDVIWIPPNYEKL